MTKIVRLFLGLIVVAHKLVRRLDISDNRFQGLPSKICLRINLFKTWNDRIIVTLSQITFWWWLRRLFLNKKLNRWMNIYSSSIRICVSLRVLKCGQNSSSLRHNFLSKTWLDTRFHSGPIHRSVDQFIITPSIALSNFSLINEEISGTKVRRILPSTVRVVWIRGLTPYSLLGWGLYKSLALLRFLVLLVWVLRTYWVLSNLLIRYQW